MTTNERMICEKTIVEVEHDGTGEGVSSFGITLAWVPVEPAPPPNWTPYCNDRAWDGLCSGREDEYNGNPTMCEKCPWRKQIKRE